MRVTASQKSGYIRLGQEPGADTHELLDLRTWTGKHADVRSCAVQTAQRAAALGVLASYGVRYRLSRHTCVYLLLCVIKFL